MPNGAEFQTAGRRERRAGWRAGAGHRPACRPASFAHFATSGIPRSSGFRAVRNSAPFGIARGSALRRLGFRAVSVRDSPTPGNTLPSARVMRRTCEPGQYTRPHVGHRRTDPGNPRAAGGTSPAASAGGTSSSRELQIRHRRNSSSGIDRASFSTSAASWSSGVSMVISTARRGRSSRRRWRSRVSSTRSSVFASSTSARSSADAS